MSAKTAKLKRPHTTLPQQPSTTAPTSSSRNVPLCAVPWLDTEPELQRWFADFLLKFWERIYGHDYSDWLVTNSTAARQLSSDIESLALKLPGLTTDQQLQALDKFANQYGRSTTQRAGS